MSNRSLPSHLWWAGAALGLTTVIVGCADVTQPYELDHPRVIAVRTEPATLAAGDRGRIEVLVTGAGGPRVAPSSTVTVSVPAPLAALVEVARDGETWTVTAPGMEQLTAARAALALPAEQPLALPLELATEVDGVELIAQKWVVVGATVANPAITSVTVDGAAAATARVRAGSTPQLAVAHDAGADAVVRWLSSVGDLEDYQTSTATLDATTAATGALVVVVRDRKGGASWQIVPAVVE